jgi:hypothetical protein
MPVRNQNWYNLQETRRYPLDDASTGVDDSGEPINDSIIVDCHLRFPQELGNYAFISAITVSPGIVTVLFSAATAIDNNSVFTPIAAVSLPKPIQKNTNYNITPLVAGAAGWVAFGAGVDEPFSGKYSSPRQTFLQPRSARSYRSLPIPSIGKLSLATALSDIVRLEGIAPVAAVFRTLTVEGEEVPAIVFELQGETADANPLKDLLGPCGGRPESGTCAKPTIQTINGVSPDCEGNIEIEFDGFTGLPFSNCGGIDILTTVGLQETCESTDPPRQYSNLCAPSSAGSDYWPDPADQLPDPPLPDIYSSISISEASIGCLTLPVCYDFSAGTAPEFKTLRGLFVFDSVVAPLLCGAAPDTNSNLAASSELSVSSETIATPHLTYTAADITGTNIAILQNCATDWALGKTITTQLMIRNSGLKRNGGLIINYLAAKPAFNVPTTYLLLLLEVESATFKILRFNGSSFVKEYETNYPMRANVWYDISVTPIDNDENVLLQCQIKPTYAPSPQLNTAVDIANYGNPIGQCGFYSAQAYTSFNKLTIY